MAENVKPAIAPPVRAFQKDVAPAFMDHVCITSGFAPPPGSPLGEGVGAGFSYCELHCGTAVTSTLLAASNPLGDFHALDPRGEAIESARKLASDGKVRNITFHKTGVEDALQKGFGPFDYIVVNGVYTWVPLRERALILSFVRKFLKPGGAAYVSYNARPGWNRLDPFRRVLRESSRGLTNDPREKLAIAREVYAKLSEAKAPGIASSGITPVLLEQLNDAPPDAIAADYANDFADPLYITEVASDFAAIDCVFAGPSDIAESAGVLGAHEPYKSLFAKMPTPVGRELVKDFVRDTRIRRDVFVRGGKRLAAGNRDMVLKGLAFALEQPVAAIRYRARTPAGEMAFDNPHARALVAALAESPRSLGDLMQSARANEADANTVAANIHALLVSGQIRPVYRATSEAAAGANALQAAIRARAGTTEGIGYLPSAFGTAFAVPIPDQLFMFLPQTMPAEALARNVAEKFSGRPDVTVHPDHLSRRARAYKRAFAHYRALGLLPDDNLKL